MRLIYSGVAFIFASMLLISCGRATRDQGGNTEIVSDTVTQNSDSLKLAAGVYVNDHLGYSLTYPKDILTIQEETDNLDQQVFSPNEGKAKLTIYKDERKDKSGKILSFNEAYELDSENKGNRQIAYNALRPLFYTISGVEGQEIFYQKTIISKNTLVTAKLTYTKQEKSTYDAMIASLFGSFK